MGPSLLRLLPLLPSSTKCRETGGTRGGSSKAAKGSAVKSLLSAFGAGGGGVARAGELLFTPLKRHLFAQLSGPFKDHLMVLPAAFGHEAGIIGAAALALEAV